MYASDGVSRIDHDVFQALQNRHTRFECRYIEGRPPVHSKIYLWLREGQPYRAFVGSANYSRGAIFGRTRECLVQADEVALQPYVMDLVREATPCQAIEAVRYKTILDDVEVESEELDANLANLRKVRLPLTEGDKGLRVHARSGLNWGQRQNREPNQAYIPVPSKVAKSGFFPDRGDYFLIATDDGQSLECVIAQDNDKAVETPQDNSILGRYFRDRLGVLRGSSVNIDDLQRYGRHYVEVYLLPDGTYFMDFRRPL